jgi:hypothetical protein
MVIMTRQRVTELVMIARTNGSAAHLFAGVGGAALVLHWLRSAGKVLILFRYADGDERIVLDAEGIEAALWAAIERRMDRLVRAPAANA